jgi:voltage-gated potassium channel
MTTVPAPRSPADAARLAAFEQRMNIPILISAILPIIISFGPDDDVFFVAVMAVTWGVFIADYVVHMRLLRGYARSRRGMFDLAVVFLTAPWFLIPGLGGSQFVALARLARLARIAKVSDGGVRRLIQQLGRVGLYTLLLVVACAYVAYQVERPVNDQFADFGDSVFWAIVTITTVGYGDIVPVTTVGRLMSVVLMFSGVGLLGVLAGTLASFFGFGDNDDARESDEDAGEVPADASGEEAGEAESIALGSPPESSLTVPDSLDVAALRTRLADLDEAVAALRSQLQ